MSSLDGKIMVCNLALGKLGLPPIQSLEQANNASRACNQFYNHCLSFVLRQHFWGFATKRRTLSHLTETPDTEFSYQFSLPTDLVRLEVLLDEEHYEENDGKILADVTPISIKYVYLNTNVASYSSDFIEAFALYLAHSMCVSLVANMQLSKDLYQEYAIALSRARTADSGESRNKKADDMTSWERDRLGYGQS